MCHSDSSSKENQNVVNKFGCCLCPKWFVEKRSLVRHLRKKHGLDPSTATGAAKKAKRKVVRLNGSNAQNNGYGGGSKPVSVNI